MRGTIYKIIFAVSLVPSCVAVGPAHAQQKTVSQYGCANDQAEKPQQKKPQQTVSGSMRLDVPDSLTGKIAFYTDMDNATNPLGVVAPDGWQCTIDVTTRYVLTVSKPSVISHAHLNPASVNEEAFSTDGGLGEAILFYNMAVPIFPAYFPGNLLSYDRPIYRSNGETISDSDIEKQAWLGSHNKIIHVNGHTVIIITPGNVHGFAGQGNPFAKSSLPVYSIVGIDALKKNQPPIAYVIQITWSSLPGYSVEPFLKLNEQQIEAALKNYAGAD